MEPVDLKSRRTLEEFESRGESGVRQAIAQQLWGPDTSEKIRLAEAWLEAKEAERDEEHRRNRTDELVDEAKEANRLARAANKTSKEANRVAVAAFILAAVALALSLGLF